MASRGQNIFKHHFLFSNRLVQLILGISLDQSPNNHLFVFFSILFYLFPGIVHQFYQLSMANYSMQSTVKLFHKTMSSMCLLCGYSTTFFNFATMKLLIFHFKHHCDLLSDIEEMNILEKSIMQTKSYAYAVLILFNAYNTSILFPCIFKVFLYFFGISNDNQLILPASADYSMNAGTIYYCLLIYQTFAIIIISTVGGISFSTYLTAVEFACFQFNVIMLKLKQPFEDNSKSMEKNACYMKTHKDQWDWIVDIILRYRNVTMYVNLLNDFSKVTYLITVLLAMSLVVFDFVYLFQLSLESENVIEIIECSIYIVGTVFTIYINFYLGQKLLDYSNEVLEELCHIPFYMLSMKIQKLLLFIITRSKKPCFISIGGMFVSSHEIFAGLMRKALSFAMVYYNVQ